MSILSRLFGSGGSGTPETPKQAESETYKDFVIYPEPYREGSQWRVGARIEKGSGDDLKVHQLVRADTLESQEAASAASIGKARQMIDEQGDGLFR